MRYTLDGAPHVVGVYPTLQFLYRTTCSSTSRPGSRPSSRATATSPAASWRRCAAARTPPTTRRRARPRGLRDARRARREGPPQPHPAEPPVHPRRARRRLLIGMKDQFNGTLPSHPLAGTSSISPTRWGSSSTPRMAAAAADAPAAPPRSIDTFGCYHVEHYILMEVLSKQSRAQRHRLPPPPARPAATGVQAYGEAQGKGFVCWRFINEKRA